MECGLRISVILLANRSASLANSSNSSGLFKYNANMGSVSGWVSFTQCAMMHLEKNKKSNGTENSHIPGSRVQKSLFSFLFDFASFDIDVKRSLHHSIRHSKHDIDVEGFLHHSTIAITFPKSNPKVLFQ